MRCAVDSWRTTVSGLLVILAGVVLMIRSTDPTVQTTAGALVVAGIGLVRAKDA